MRIPDKVYDVLKWVCLIVLPATSALYWKIADLWGLPYAEQVTGTIAAVGFFLGALIGVSSISYYKDKQNESE